MRGNRAIASARPQVALPDDDADDDAAAEAAAEHATWSPERATAEALAGELQQQWEAPMATLSKAGKAFEGLEALLGGARGGGFDLKVSPGLPACMPLQHDICCGAACL